MHSGMSHFMLEMKYKKKKACDGRERIFSNLFGMPEEEVMKTVARARYSVPVCSPMICTGSGTLHWSLSFYRLSLRSLTCTNSVDHPQVWPLSLFLFLFCFFFIFHAIMPCLVNLSLSSEDFFFLIILLSFTLFLFLSLILSNGLNKIKNLRFVLSSWIFFLQSNTFYSRVQ